MSYIVNQDIIDRVGNERAAQLTTDSGTTPDQTVLDRIREDSEGEVNRHLSKRIGTPVDVSTDTDLAAALKAVTLDVAEYRLCSRRPPVTEDKVRMYTEVLKWLVSFSKGEANLPGAVTPAGTNSDNPKSSSGYLPQQASYDVMI